MSEEKSPPRTSVADDPDATAIRRRRNRLLALALGGASFTLPACCLSMVEPPQDTGSPPIDAGTDAMVAMDAGEGDAGEAPDAGSAADAAFDASEDGSAADAG